MAKNSVADWSTTAEANTDVAGYNISPGSYARDLNNAIQNVMGQAKTKFDDVDTAVADIVVDVGDKQPASANLDEYAAVNPTAAGLALLDDANADAQLTTLGGGTAGVAAFKAAAVADIRNQLDTPAYVADRTALAALDPTKDTTAVLVEDGYQGLYSAVDPADHAGIVTEGAGYEIIATGNVNLSYLRQRKVGDLVKVSEQGGDIQRALDVAAEIATELGGTSRVTVEQNWVGTKTISSGLIIPANVDFVPMTSSGKSVISAGALAATALVKTDGTIGAGGRYALFAGTPADSAHTVLPDFGTVALGDTVMTFASAHGLAVGDWVKVWEEADYSWHGSRDYYKKGFAARVVAVVSSTVAHLSRPFRDAYTYSSGAPVVRAYKQSTRKIRLGFELDMSGQAVSTGGGAFLSCLSDSDLYDIVVRDGLYSAIQLDQCHDINIRTLTAHTQATVGATLNAYGQLITNSTGIHTYNANLFSPWHGRSLGGESRTGNIQNYDVVLHDSTVATNGTSASSPHTVDMHGNADLCGYINVKAHGFSMSGRDPFMIGCDSTVHPDNAVSERALSMTEVYGGWYRIENSKFYSVLNSGTSTSTAGSIKMELTADTVIEPRLTLDNCDIDMPNEQSPVHIQTGAGTTVGYSYAFRNGRAKIPSSAFGLGYLGNAGGAPTGEFLDVWPTSLTVGKPYASNPTGSALFTRQSFKPQVLLKNYTATATTSYSPPSETLDHGLPVGYTPRAVATLQSAATGAKSCVRIFGTTATTVRATIYTGDATNLTAAAVDVAIVVQ